MKNLSEQLLSAANSVLNEAREPKKPLFNVGDEVGLASDYTSFTHHHSPGKVVKTNAHGHTIVSYGHKDNEGKEITHTYDMRGRPLKDEYSNKRIISRADWDAGKKKEDEQKERNKDLSSISELVAGHRNGFGNHSKLSKEHAARIKELVDKHTSHED